MTPHVRRFALVMPLVALLAVGCGGESDEADTAEATEAGDTTANADAAPPSSGEPYDPQAAEKSMTVEDIDRWARGMEGELEAVREAGRKLKAAKSGTDSLNAIMAANDMSTRAAGARAAGVAEDRYGLINSTLSSVVRYMAPLEAEMNVSQMPAEMVTAMKQNRDSAFARVSAPFPPAVVEAPRPRAEALRKQELALTGERLRAAGMAP